jgi:hypothetical protein
MKSGNLSKRLMRKMVALAIGGSVLQVGGCDPAVRQVLLTGLAQTTQGLSSALITAFFLTLEDDTTTTQ